MSVHYVHDLGQGSLVKPYAPVEAVCGAELREAHEVSAPESEAEVCAECLSWARRNKFQNRRCAVEMSARPAEGAGQATRKASTNSAETGA